MRILHTADWHLGHTLHGVDRLPEHAAFLDWLVGVVQDRGVDVVRPGFGNLRDLLPVGSRIPSFLYCTEHFDEDGLGVQDLGELFDQGQQAVFRHGWDELEEHDALAQQ